MDLPCVTALMLLLKHKEQQQKLRKPQDQGIQFAGILQFNLIQYLLRHFQDPFHTFQDLITTSSSNHYFSNTVQLTFAVH